MTAANWNASKIGNNLDQHNIYDDSDPNKGKWIGTINGKDNANKASAAPDLLAALEAVMCFWAETCGGGDDDEMPTSIFDNAHAAIAKARGES